MRSLTGTAQGSVAAQASNLVEAVPLLQTVSALPAALNGHDHDPQSDPTLFTLLNWAAPREKGAALPALPAAPTRLPVYFEANVGQADPAVRFLTRGPDYSLFLTDREAVMVLPSMQDEPAVLRMQLVGETGTASAVGRNETPGTVNYFVGSDPEQWHTRVPTYARVEYPDVYPGIDLVYHGSQRQLEYDFVVSPGADPSQVRLHFAGAERVEIDDRGDLVLHTRGAQVRQHRPFAYQEIHGVRREVASRFVLHDQQVAFQVAAYDPTQPLVIDPVVSFSTYLGGTRGDIANAVAVDAEGNVYVIGETNSSDFPTVNAAQPKCAGLACSDVFVSKLSADGSELLYSTFLGGGNQDWGYGIAVDASGNAYVTGAVTSRDFPTVNPFQPDLARLEDGFVSVLDATGSSLLYSTYLGGTGIDYGKAIGVDGTGNIFVAGYTQSADFPLANAVQPTHGGGFWDAFVTQISADGTQLVYSTYLGGDNVEVARGLAVDAKGNAFVAGQTSSRNFPTVNALQPEYGGGLSDFIAARLTPSGEVVYATFLGGVGNDTAHGVGVDAEGNATVAGLTDSFNFPTRNALQPDLTGEYDAAAARLSPDGGKLLWSTYLGGTGQEFGRGVAVDAEGSAYLTGETHSLDFPVLKAVQPKPGGGTCPGYPCSDAFVSKIQADGSALVYSTYLGGEGLDGAWGIAVTPAGDAAVAGQTLALNFPTVNPLQAKRAGGLDAFVTKLGTEA